MILLVTAQVINELIQFRICHASKINTTIFHAFWLVNLEVISKVLSTSNQSKKTSDHFVSVLSDVHLIFWSFN